MAQVPPTKMASFLSGIRFFAELKKESLSKLGEHTDQLTFRNRQKIFEKGDPGDAMYAIYSGRVMVHDEDHEYGFLQAGECFGEYAMIDREDRSATVTAVEETIVFRIGAGVFIELMKDDAGFARGILRVMIDRHRELDTIQEKLATSKKELEYANARMSGLINGAMDSILLFDSKFRIILANPAALSMLENDDVLQRNLLFFLDEAGASMVETLAEEARDNSQSMFLPVPVKVIGSGGSESINEGTISHYGNDPDSFFILILRNIKDRLEAEDKIEMLSDRTHYLQDELDQLNAHHGILGEDPGMVALLGMVKQVASTDATVLVHGETGTGKELVAKAIHEASSRKDKPFIRINCGAIPANLIESELFGHEKGAFTGATSSRKGRFMLADKGTLFLDEIGELPLDLQPKLLRVIQEGEFDPVGSNTTHKVDVRILAATHRDLLALSREGKFREDLYYRLNVFPLVVPPLRQRGGDVCLIAEEMIRRFAASLGKPAAALSDEDRALFQAYDWPGNVRELQNIIERAMIISQNGKVNWRSILPAGQASGTTSNNQAPERIMTAGELTSLERDNILRALKLTKWKVSGKGGAAELLDIPPTTLASKIKAHNISRPV